MTRCQSWGVSLLALLVVLASQGLQAAEKLATEQDKIEALIHHVENLQGARFMVAKRVFPAADAAKFLRWGLSQNRVKTAEEFIVKVATHYMSRPFSIRLGNGKTMRSGEYLRGELKKLDGLPTDELAVALQAKPTEAKQPVTPKQAVPQPKAVEPKSPVAAAPKVNSTVKQVELSEHSTTSSTRKVRGRLLFARGRSVRRAHRFGTSVINKTYVKNDTPKLMNQA